MASEKFANLAETTLASGYTSGTMTLSVASAAGFPTVGTFRVRLGNSGKTIWRVDSVSGTTFTGAAEANDANALTSDTVKIVASRAVAERFAQSPDSGEARLVAGVSGVDFYGPIYKLTPIVAAQFSWDNQGASTIVDANGISYLTAAPGAGTQRRMRLKTQPATPYVVTIGVIPRLRIANGFDCGISFRESATAKHASIGVFGFNQGLRVIRGTAAGNYTAEMAAIANLFLPSVLWFRISNDNTTLRFLYSADGVNYVELFNEAKTASFTTAPDQVGYYVNDEDGTITASGSFLSWLES